MKSTSASRNAFIALILAAVLPGCLFGLGSLTGHDPPTIDNSDDYRPEPAAEDQVEQTGCGKLEFSVRAVELGGDRWGSYEYTGRQWPGPIDCAKMPKKDKFDKKFAAGVQRARDQIDIDGIVVWDGAYSTATDEEDLHVYQYATLVFYSPDFKFSNACGGTDPKLVCEASGSIAVSSYNQLVHNLQRAEVRRKQGDVDRCKYLLELAVGRYTIFHDVHDHMKKQGTWVPGLTYRIRSGEHLSEDQLLYQIETAGTKAQEQTRTSWCASK